MKWGECIFPESLRRALQSVLQGPETGQKIMAENSVFRRPKLNQSHFHDNGFRFSVIKVFFKRFCQHRVLQKFGSDSKIKRISMTMVSDSP